LRAALRVAGDRLRFARREPRRAAGPRRARSLLHRRRAGPRPGAVRPGPRDGQARRAALRGAGRQGRPRRLRRLPAARPRLRHGDGAAAGRRPRGPRHPSRSRSAAHRQRRDRDGASRPRRPQGARRLREPRGPHTARRGRAPAGPGAARARQQRVRRPRGRREGPRRRDLPPRSPAAEEHVVRGLADRHRDPSSDVGPGAAGRCAGSWRARLRAARGRALRRSDRL
ncbi:MAG: Putative amidotransferase similar to cobyric acid synthase, partial [uncultured Solirubrobacteraceae bacterium]